MNLSPAQVEIMDDLISGLSQREIARTRGVIHQTIAAHVDKVKSKLGALTTVEAAVIYDRRKHGTR